MNDLEELHYSLGLEFERNKEAGSITMNQKNYIEKVLKRFIMEECNPVITPFDANSILSKLAGEQFENLQREMEGFPYKAGVGSLMDETVAMRNNIAFAVSTMSQFMSRAGPPHWMAVKRIMRYLKGT